MSIDFIIEQHVARPRQEVFYFVTDPARLKQWDRRVTDAVIAGPAGNVAVGTRIREVRAVGPRRLEQLVEVSAYDPPERFGLRVVEGPVPVDGDLEFLAPTPAETVVRLHAHGHAPRRLRWLEPALRLIARRQMRSQYRRLARVLEGP